MNNFFSPYNFVLLPIRVFFTRILLLAGVCLISYGIFLEWDIPSDTEHRESIFLVDTSLSMVVEDILWEDNILNSRLDTAKNILREVNIHGNRSLMIFASSSKLQLPLSNDITVWNEIVNSIEPIQYWSSTDIESAIASTVLLYPKKNIDVYILTDGERTSEWESMTWVIVWEDMRLHIIGIGTANGGKIISNYDGNGNYVYKKYDWKDIISRLDREYLQQIADRYWATLHTVEKASDLWWVIEYIWTDSTTAIQWTIRDWILIFGSICILLGLIIPDYRKK